MFLEHLKVNNFRQLENVEMHFNESLSFVAGGNNSGKTSLVNMIEFAFDRNKVISYKDMNSMFFMKMIQEIEKEFKNSTYDKIEALQLKLSDFATRDEANIQMFYTLDVGDKDDLRHVGRFLIALEEDLKLHFLIEYGLVKEKVMDKEEVVQRLFDHFQANRGESKEKTQSYYVHAMNLLDELSGRKINYLSGSIENDGYHYENNRDKYHLIKEKDYFSFIYSSFIPAQKHLDEYGGSQQGLNELMLKNLQINVNNWDQTLRKITDFFRKKIDKDITPEALNEQVSALNNAMKKYRHLNGNRNDRLKIEFTHQYDNVMKYLESIWNLHLQSEDENENGYTLPNSMQGLGFNHLLYIYFHVETLATETKDETSKFNILVIEEPENHMHPHMQQMLVRYLYEAKEKLNFQIILTTHSSDIVKNLEIEDIRVLKKEENRTQEYDLSVFMKDLDEDKKKFYEKFFSVTMYPLIFSDSAIFYEGDTERLFLVTLLSNRSLLEKVYNDKQNISQGLRNRYISLIQAGGAYAHCYFDLLEYLDIRTVVFTDIDYDKSCQNLSDLTDQKDSKNCGKQLTTNGVIKKCIGEEELKSVSELAYHMRDGCFVDEQKLIKVFTQTEKDGYARTLEDAMLFHYLGVKMPDKFDQSDSKKVFTEFNREEWAKVSKEYQIAIPKIGTKGVEKESIRQRVEKGLSQSSKKTDFMYSFLMKEEDDIVLAVPNYVRRGLEWLVSEDE